jgi:hypothetical protein
VDGIDDDEPDEERRKALFDLRPPPAEFRFLFDL